MRSLTVVLIVLGSLRLASAQQGGAEDAALADKIFEEAQKLKQEGKTAEACKKYQESLTHNHNAVGTLLNVALCAEQDGKVATALKYFTQARDLAREHNLKEHQKAAEEHVEKNRGLVPHLAIAFAEIAPNMKLVIDDVVYPTDKASDIGIDPGSHHVVVTAPGRVPYETTVVMEQGQPKAIAVPKLGYPVSVNKGRRTVGKIVTFTGAGLIGTGVVLGLVARSRYQAQIDKGFCSDDKPPMCNPDGYQATGNARTLGNVGTVVGIAGGVALGVGAYLWFFAPKEQAERNVAIVPTLDRQSAGVAAVGRF